MFKTIIESSKINHIIIFTHFRMNENEKKLFSVKKYAINFNTELLLGDVLIEWENKLDTVGKNDIVGWMGS